MRQSVVHVMKNPVSEAALDELPKLPLATYEEDCWRLRVWVLSDESDETFERFTLQVVASLSRSALPENVSVGTTFLYLRRRGFYCGGMLFLKPRPICRLNI